VVIGGVRFNVPPQAIRAAVQRRAGAQERLDLVYLWPSLDPPDPAAATAGPAERDRVFVTIATAASLPPVERLKNIYPRYTAPDPSPAPAGLSVFGFRDGTPYQGEDLAFDPAAPERFLARCARTINRLTPGTCLYERRVGEADITVRFPRDWLEGWRDVAAGLDRLIEQLRPAGGRLLTASASATPSCLDQSRSVPRIAIWKLYERSLSSSSTNRTPMNSSPI